MKSEKQRLEEMREAARQDRERRDRVYQLVVSVGDRVQEAAERSPKLRDWLDWDKNADALSDVLRSTVTAFASASSEEDEEPEEREKLQERIDELGKDLDDFNEHEAEATPDGAKKLIEDYKNLEADMTITAVAIPPKMQNDFDSLEQGYNDVEEYAALDDAGFFDALNKATRDINVLARTDKNGREQITKTTGKGKSAKTVVTPGRFYKTVVADVQKAINNAEAALSATSTLTPGKGDMEYRSHWGAYAWSQLEDAKGEFDEYDMTKPEAMAKEAHLDFDKANVWLATAKPGSHWLGDWRDAEVLLSHGRLADPSTVAEVLVKWSAAMQDNEKLADMLRAEWVWLKHLYDEKAPKVPSPKVSPPKPSAPKPPPKPVIPVEQRFSEAVQQAVQKGARSVDDATTSASRILEAAGDTEAASAGNIYWDARVRNVTSRAMIQAGVTPVWAMPLREFMSRPGGYIPPGADWTFQSSPLPAEEVANQKVEDIREKLKASKEGQELLRDEARYPVPKGKAAKALWEKYTAAKDAQWQMQQAAKPYHQWQLWMASRRLAKQEGYAVPDMDERAPEPVGKPAELSARQAAAVPASAAAKLPKDYELVQRGRDRVDVLHKTRTLGHVDSVSGRIEWSPSIPRTRDFGIDLPKAVIQAAMGMLKHSAETKAAPADPGLWPLPKSMPVLTPKVVARAASHHGADPFFLGAVIAALGKGIELGAEVGGQFNSGYRSEQSDPGMNYDEGTKAEMALRAAAREVGVLSPAGMSR